MKSVMRRAGVLLAAAGAGLVGASAAAVPGVSLEIRPKAIVYGDMILLKGKLPAARAGEEVVVHAGACGFTKAVPVRTLRTRRGGAFTFRVGPTLRTTYSVSWRRRTSRRVTVGVAPKVALEKVGPQAYRISASVGGGSSFEGKRAQLQRLFGRRWRTVGAASLTLTSPPDALTSVSSATVNASMARGARLRAVLPLSEARPCYVPGTSDTLKVR